MLSAQGTVQYTSGPLRGACASTHQASLSPLAWHPPSRYCMCHLLHMQLAQLDTRPLSVCSAEQRVGESALGTPGRVAELQEWSPGSGMPSPGHVQQARSLFEQAQGAQHHLAQVTEVWSASNPRVVFCSLAAQSSGSIGACPELAHLLLTLHATG